MGGAVGDFHLFVVDSYDGKLQSREITPLMYKEFGHPFRCDAEGKYHEVPNVGGIGWVGDTHHVWVAAEVMPHSVCDSDGTFRAYEVDPAAMRVLQTLDQLEAKRQLWAMLGEELRAAPDECVRKPRSCFVLTNHPDLYSK
jgi:hypothetical protein